MIGRDRDVVRLRKKLDASGLCVLVGPAGVGKSTVAKAVVDNLGEAAVLIDAAEIGDGAALTLRIAEYLDVEHLIGHQDRPSQRLRLVAERFGAAGVELLAIDHVDLQADNERDELFALAADLASSSTALHVLVVSQQHPPSPVGSQVAQVVRLTPLAMHPNGNPSPAAQLFRDAYLAAGGEVVSLTAEHASVMQLIQATGGLPLIVTLFASRAAVIGIDNALIGARLDAANPLADAIRVSIGQLESLTQFVFEAFGHFSCDLTVAEVATICEIMPAQCAAAVEHLARRSLAEVSAAGVHLLAPVRQCVRSAAIENGRRELLDQRRVEWALAAAHAQPSMSTKYVLQRAADLAEAATASAAEGRFSDAVAIADLLDDAFRADMRHARRVEFLEPLATCFRAVLTSDSPPEFVDATIELVLLNIRATTDAVGAVGSAPLLAEAMSLARRSNNPEHYLARIRSYQAGLAFDCGDLVAARCAAVAGIEASTKIGDLAAICRSLKLLADVELESGHLTDALRLSNEAVRGTPPALRQLRSYALATVAACELERGATRLTLAASRTIEHEAAQVGDIDLLVESDWLDAMADPLGAPRSKHALNGDRIGNSTIHIQADIARALRRLAGGDPQAALALAADCELRAGALPMRSLAIDAQILVGECALLLGEGDEAARAFRQALLDSSTMGYRLRVPDTLDGLGQLIGDGRLRSAGDLIRTQLASVMRPRPWRSGESTIARQVPRGWVQDGSLTDDGLAAALIVLDRRDWSRSSESTPSELSVLSPAERVVADLVAAGCTNREIADRLYVSRRTVESHIAHAFQKLDVSSRTQLAAIVLTS